MKKEKTLQKRTWTGKWIEPVQEKAWHTPQLSFAEMVDAEKSGVPSEKELRRGKHLRRKIDLKNESGELPVTVTAYASAHGVYDLYINGCKADKRMLAPETTNYEKLIWYQKYDLSDLCLESDIAYIDVLLGDGWWIGRLGMGGSSCNYGDRLAFIMDLELVYADGSMVTIGSDEQFLSCDSFILYSDLYVGEMQDGRAFDYVRPARNSQDRDKRTNTGENEDSGSRLWEPCEVTKASVDLLAEQVMPGVTVISEIPCVSYINTPNGDLVADFGRVLAGTVRIQVDAPADTVITIEHGEVLDPEGNYYNNIKGLYKDQKDRYICRGGLQVFAPRFTYHGFRYIRISGINKKQILDLTALEYSTPMEKIGFFETDHPMINALQTAIENSTTSNMISVPTDCPQREKLGWTGDINIFTKTGAFLYDLRAFLGSWLLQVRLDQTSKGEIPVVVPNHPSQDQTQRGMSGGTNSSAAWSDCIIFMPLELYRLYGDISFLTDNFDAMTKWLRYVEKQAPDGLWRGRFHFGDWLIPSLREEPDGVMKGVMATSDIVGSCYYSLAVSAMTEICSILGEEEKEKYYRKLKSRIDQALVKTYVYGDGRVGVHAAEESQVPDPQLQGLYVVMLKTGAVKDEALKNKMLQRLVSLIAEADYTLDCGFASIGFLLDVLYDNGFADIAYKILFNTKAPSWLYMVEHGATTIWENWRAIKEDGTVTDSSYNHYAYGCVGEFLYRHIGGIECLEPGFSKVKIAPDFHCGIRSSTLKRQLPGKESSYILCRWNLDEGQMHIEIPEGVRAQVVLPDTVLEADAGTYDYSL